MNSELDSDKFELLYVIINRGSGSKILRAAKHHSISGGTIVFARGTAHHGILAYLGLSDTKKEIVFLAADRQKALQLLLDLNNEFDFSKPNHGIAFSIPISSIKGSKNTTDSNKNNEKRDGDSIMYQMITAIVDKGKAEDVVSAAEKAGSRGGTVVNARGSGAHETSKLFSMEIEPEKQIVIILAKVDVAKNIVNSIKDELKMDEPGNGIVYTQPVDKAFGIR